MEPQGLPPAIVLGIDSQIGLTVVRELGEHGVPVYGVAANKRGIGLYSRWLRRGYLRHKGDDETIALLNAISAETGAKFLLTVSEKDALFVARAEAEGRLPGLRPLVPAPDKMQFVIDKLSVCRLAEEIGIDIPRSWEPKDAAEAARPPEDLSYPNILKWRDPNQAAGALSGTGIPVLKSEYCYTVDELRRALGRYDVIGRYPLVQSFCPGVGLGHMVFMHDGQPILRFQHRRIGEWPPDGGISTLCESISLSENAALFALSVRLLQRIGWEGAAMVEYRFDPASGRAALMEINGRFWGSLPLAYHAGAPFAWLSYSVLGLGQSPEIGPYREGLVCRFMVPEIRRLFTLFFRRSSIQDRAMALNRWHALGQFFAGFFRPSTRYYVFSWRDPKPFFADLGFMAAKALRALFRR